MSQQLLSTSIESRAGKTPSSVKRVRSVVAALFGPPDERSFTVRYWDGSEEAPGILSETPFTLWFRRPGALRRMLLPPSELSIAEAFIDGDVDLDGNAEYAMHLGDAMGSRLQTLGGFTALLPLLLALPTDKEGERLRAVRRQRFPHGLNSFARREGGADAIQHHYDVGNEFYKLWLDERMVYTCAWFRSPTESLESAQAAKLDLICRKLRLEPGMRFLDIGCGWGALIMHAAANYGVSATGITLSEAQAGLARKRIAEAGLTDRCHIELRDYRDLGTVPEYQRIASVGMMEHVGYERLPGYFEAAYRVLETGGVFLNHTIVRDGHRGDPTPAEKMKSRLWKRDQFIHRYVFPDGQLVPVSHVVECAERAGFELRDVEALREHYAMTLRHWLRRLEAHTDEATDLVGERKFRTWRLYLLAAINGFRAGRTSIIQAILAKCDTSGTSGMPLTRDYMMYLPPLAEKTGTREAA
jgi:cyclopropane-fatty-acyl-phospholipid synthase